MSKVFYVKKRHLLREIHRSKNSYCEYDAPEFSQYDLITESLREISQPGTQQQALEAHRHRVATANYHAELDEFEAGHRETKPRLNWHKQQAQKITNPDLVYRVYTYEHIPRDPARRKNPKNDAERHVRLNFRPFKHYVIREGKPVEVGRSHTLNGEFSDDHGSITNELARMYLLLVERYSHRPNWRGYSYLEEMKSQALIQCADMGLKFDEFITDNPFGYFTRILENSFTHVLNQERKQQMVKDEIRISMGELPSYSRQMAHEEEIRELRDQNDS